VLFVFFVKSKAWHAMAPQVQARSLPLDKVPSLRKDFANEASAGGSPGGQDAWLQNPHSSIRS